MPPALDPPLDEGPFHGRRGSQQGDAGVAGRLHSPRGDVGDVQDFQTGGLLNLVRPPMAGIGADHDKVRTGARQRARCRYIDAGVLAAAIVPAGAEHLLEIQRHENELSADGTASRARYGIPSLDISFVRPCRVTPSLPSFFRMFTNSQAPPIPDAYVPSVGSQGCAQYCESTLL